MTWVQDQLDDETLFPSKIGKKYSGISRGFQNNLEAFKIIQTHLKSFRCISNHSEAFKIDIIIQK